MKSQSNQILRKMIPGIIFGFLVLLAILLVGDLKQVGRNIYEFDWMMMPAVLALTLFNYTLRFVKWHYYLNLVGIKNLPVLTSLKLFIGGFPLAVTPGKVGEVLKGVWLNKQTGLPVARGVSVVVAERISDGLAVLFLSLAGVVVYPQFWPAFILVLVGLLSIVVVSQIRPAALWILDKGANIRFIKKIMHNLREFYEGSYILFNARATLTAVSLGFVSWLGEGIGFFLILKGLGLEVNFNLLAFAVFVLSFSTVVGAASALPGGLGAAEASIAGMLGLYGISPSIASSATLLIRLATLWFGVFLGLLTWAMSPRLFGLVEEKDDPD